MTDPRPAKDLGTFWACHSLAFAHFGGVPGSFVYDRTKTVVRAHVAPGKAVPLRPEAVAVASHHGFMDVTAAYRPTAKGRDERQVLFVRDHVLGPTLRLTDRARRSVRRLAADPSPGGAPNA